MVESKENWVSATLVNDENSSDSEMVKYFIKEGNMDKNEAKHYVAQRNEALLNGFEFELTPYIRKKVTKTIGGKKRTFIQKDDYEFDEVGLKRKDFVEKRTKAFPTAEGWFHIKKPVKVSASNRARKHTRRKPRRRN